MIPPDCSYCTKRARLVREGESGYPYSQPWGPAWLCKPCDAFVGCYQGSEIPLGTLANAELREWRRSAHAALDALWQTESRSRSHVYGWLAKQLGIPRRSAHIALMDAEGCARVIDLCRSEA
jgi:hypothetical protein